MSRLFLGITFGACLMFAVAAVEQLLPSWCADPDVGGNYLVQPLCK